jgi:RecA-family ATPase
MMHIALGWEYRGRRVKQGLVVYIACEGERGLSARAEAFRQKHLGEEESVPGFYLLTTRLDLVTDHKQLIADIRDQLGGVVPVAIGIDTLNRSLAGSESSDEDMGCYIKAADAVREAFGCAVLIVHHCGVVDNRPRGHTSLTGAADAQIAVRRDEAGLVGGFDPWGRRTDARRIRCPTRVPHTLLSRHCSGHMDRRGSVSRASLRMQLDSAWEPVPLEKWL